MPNVKLMFAHVSTHNQGGTMLRCEIQLIHILIISFLLHACGQAKPPPPLPSEVLAVLRHYPNGILIKDTIQEYDDTMYKITFRVQTTVEAARTYYDAPLQTLHLKGQPGNPDTITQANLPLDYEWVYDGCPFHGVDLSVTATELHLIYSTGLCR